MIDEIFRPVDVAVAEISSGAAFIVDYIGDDGDTEMADITPDDIQSIISEVELPFNPVLRKASQLAVNNE